GESRADRGERALPGRGFPRRARLLLRPQPRAEGLRDHRRRRRGGRHRWPSFTAEGEHVFRQSRIGRRLAQEPPQARRVRAVRQRLRHRPVPPRALRRRRDRSQGGGLRLPHRSADRPALHAAPPDRGEVLTMRALLSALLLLPLVAHAQCGPVADADIIGRASGALPFAQQSGYGVQVYGKHLRANAIPEDGIQGPALANGDTLRFGKANNALVFQLDPRDPVTSRSKRSEISFEPNIEPDKVYWIAFSVFLEDWGRLHPQDAALFGTQVHSGDNSLNLSPAFSLYTTAE